MEIISNQWNDYEIIDAGDGEKLERWGKYLLRRPDPACLWPKDPRILEWNHPDGYYHRKNTGGGSWQFFTTLPEYWTLNYHDLTFKVAPTGFKHTGLFPEQAANWDWVRELISNQSREISVLNLFAYTGAASLAASKAGAKEVCHVDASKGMNAWAKENVTLSHLEDHQIRFIVDDVLKFVQREARRGHVYQGIIMDPPSYGRGPDGEMWKLEQQLPKLIAECEKILDPDPLFFLVNSYTTGYSEGSLSNLLKLTLGKKYPHKKIETGSLNLPIKREKLILPTGIVGRVY